MKASLLLLLPLTLLLITPLCAAEESPMTDEQKLKQMKEDYQRAKKIDQYITQELERKKITPHKLMSEETFLRRAYLNINGRIPTAEEARSYLEDDNKNKELFLVDSLVNSEGFNSHLYNFWGDLLRLLHKKPDGNGNANHLAFYLKWVRESIRDNMPYDEFVRTLIKSGGEMWDPDNPASGFYRRDYGMQLDHMAITMRVFAGTSMECAQCHDHPFDTWSQMEFYELAAFTNSKNKRPEFAQKSQEIANDIYEKVQLANKGGKNSKEVLAARTLTQNVNYVNNYYIGEKSDGLIKLPHDYKYNDGDPNEEVEARTPFGKSVRKSRRDNWDGKEALAEWLTSPENPRFTTVIAHRMWKMMMGYGFYEPIDEIRDDTKPSNKAALDYLTRTMIDMDYDLRRFVRMLCWTKVFRAEVYTAEYDVTKGGYDFRGPALRRMSAEQIWDSLLTLREGYLDDRKGTQPLTLEGTLYTWRDMDFSSLRQYFQELLEKTPNANAYNQYHRDNMGSDSFYYGKEEADGDTMMGSYNRRDKDAYGGMVRASELLTPLKPTHLIRKFGGSDRLVVNNSTREATTPEALEMMNGFVDSLILNADRSHFVKSIEKLKSPSEKVEFIYLSLLSRKPTTAEETFFTSYIENNGEDSWKDYTWSIINSHQFRFIW